MSITIAPTKAAAPATSDDALIFLQSKLYVVPSTVNVETDVSTQYYLAVYAPFGSTPLQHSIVGYVF